ncbi:arginine--tRNA ligase [Terrimonas pollutisoli]|uniref:arginine--tRNA ligase n=1 Tax=Terrimonas pollutisoli TaxID=3034147 RepID=UPI0023EA7F48|nr:arginine--tRNA ligase [Terrimonas sp. H1YJ31]
MSIVNKMKPLVLTALKNLYGHDFAEKDLTINQTKPEFEGDYTLVLFSFVKQLRKSPEQLGNEIGEYLVKNNKELFTSYNVIKGFLNLLVADNYWTGFLQASYADQTIGHQPSNGKRVIVEYSSPNTNKPLHLGHLRNNFLGWSVAEILKVTGHTVFKTAIMNDRGIHICKSMVAWLQFGEGKTPESEGIKGDHFVGDYYVLFGQEHKKEVEKLIADGMSKDDAEKKAPIMQAAQQMLIDWERGEPEVRNLWQKMNGWVYEGFNETYKKIGSDFDKNYFESDTYLLGKEFVEDGLQKGVFYKKEDGSVWIDLTADGLDEKIVQRKDGTSVYITQDLGLANQKFEEFHYDESFYVIADEQNYHMKVLKLILQKLNKPYAEGIYHLSYGLVELPTGRMKTREGTVVDADDIIEELKKVAREKTEELGKVKDFNPGELNELYDTIALGALKFFLLRVDPKKRMVFNPEESIDFHGFTGPFIQFIHARIKSILRKERAVGGQQLVIGGLPAGQAGLLPKEKELIVLLEQYPSIIAQALLEHNPSSLAVYIYEVAKTFSSFYTDHSVLSAESEEKKQLRLQLCELTANIIASAMNLLGIKVPERM